MIPPMATSTINVEVSRVGNESNASLIRRFTKKVQSSGVLNRVRGNRFHERHESKYKRKQHTLQNLKRRAELTRLAKLGKLPAKS